MILSAIWCSQSKPTMNVFMKPLLDSVNELYTKGKHFLGIYIFLFWHFSQGVEIRGRKVRVALVAASCDLPARALILNMRQFNGRHGCHLCEDEGQTAEGKPLFRWWPPNSTQKLRTRNSLTDDSIKATTNDEIVSAWFWLHGLCVLYLYVLVQWCEVSQHSFNPPSIQCMWWCGYWFSPLPLFGVWASSLWCGSAEKIELRTFLSDQR